jgi:hypothetical protein
MLRADLCRVNLSGGAGFCAATRKRVRAPEREAIVVFERARSGPPTLGGE